MSAIFRVVTRIQDQDDFSGSLTDGQFLKYNSSTNNFELQSVSPGGNSGQLQYNNSGSFAGVNHSSIGITGDIFKLNSLAVNDIPFVVKGFTGQTGNLTEWRNISDSVLAKIDFGGNFTCGAITASGAITSNRSANTDWMSCQYASSEYVKIGYNAAVGYGLIAGTAYAGTASGVGFGTNAISLRTISKVYIGTSGATFSEFDTGSNTSPYLLIHDVGLTTKPGIRINQNAGTTALPFDIRLDNNSVFCVSSTGSVVLRNGVSPTSIQITNTYTSSTSFGVLDIRANAAQTAYEISSFKGSAGGNNLPINIGHRDSAGTFTSALSVTTDNYLTLAYITSGAGARMNSCASFNWATSYQMRLHPLSYVGWDSVSETGNNVDVQLNRNAVGQLDVRGDSGFRIRNLVNSADAPLTCAAITASDAVTISRGTDAVINVNANTSTSYSGVVFKEANVAKAYVTYLNSAFATAARAEYIEIYNTSQGGVSVWTNWIKRLDIEKTGATIATGPLITRNGITPTSIQVHSTYTSATSFANLDIRANTGGTAYEISSFKGSAGGDNLPIRFGHRDAAGSFTSALSVATTGRVGIGTTSPSAKLHVRNDTDSVSPQMIAYFAGKDSIGTTDRGSLEIGFTNSSGTNSAYLKSADSTTSGFEIHTRSAISTAARFTITSTGDHTLTQGVSTSGSPTVFTVTGAAHTTLTASTEATDINFNLARTVQFATGALTTQRAMRIQAPTYSFVGASTITTASTLSISGAPVAGTNATITKPLALNIETGDISTTGSLYFTGGYPGNRINFTEGGAGWWPNISCSGQLAIGSQSSIYIYHSVSHYMTFYNGTISTYGSLIGMGSAVYGSTDVNLNRDAAGILGLRNGTNAQTLRVYSTYTSATSFANLDIRANAGQTAYEISSFLGSAGGTNLPINIGHRDSAGTFTSALSVSIDSKVGIGVAPTAKLDVRSGISSTTVIRCTGSDANSSALSVENTATGYQSSLIYSPMTRAASSAFNFLDMRAAGVQQFVVRGDGLVTCGAITASGTITGRASTTAAGTSPVKIPTGVLMTTPEAGAIEYDGTNLYFTNSAVARQTLATSGALGSYLPLAGGALTQGVSTSGSPTVFTVTGAAHTTLTASTEAVDINFNFARTVQFANGAITTQRAMRIQAPVYSHVSGSNTITTASTFSISGPPTTTGGFTTITNAYAADVESGNVRLQSGYVELKTTGSNYVRYTTNGITNSNSGEYSIISWSANSIIHAIKMTGFVYQGVNIERTTGTETWLAVNYGIGGYGATPRATLDVRGDGIFDGSVTLRKSVTSQSLSVYNTYTSATSGEWAEFNWQTTFNVLRIGTNKGSAGGTARDVAITHGGTVVANFLADRFYLGPITDGTVTGGNARGQYAVDLQVYRTAASQVASGASSVVIGTRSTAGGFGGAVAIGDAATSLNTNALAFGAATASGLQSVALNATASGEYSFATGRSTIASGANAMCLAYGGVASASYSFGLGFRPVCTRANMLAYGGNFIDQYSGVGSAQFVVFVLSKKTTDATATTLMLDSSTTRLTIPSGKIMMADILISGIKSDGSAAACYKRKVAIKNVGGTTSLVGVVETIGTDIEDNAACDVTITADNTNDALDISVTGIAAETWRWVAVVEGLEIAYGT